IKFDWPVRGDFEITAAYEILRLDEPTEGHGVGVELFVTTDSPAKPELGLFRAARVNEGEVYMRGWSVIENNQRRHSVHTTPATCKSGRLRITRTGALATLWAAEQDSDDFRNLWQQELGPEDVKFVRMAAFLGHAPNALDVRIKDLRIRALNITEAKAVEAKALAAEAANDPANPTGEKKRGWLAAAGLVALAIVAVALVVSLV